MTTVVEIITHWAARQPDASALVASGRAPLTYSQMQSAVCETAQALRARGIRRDDRVAVVLPNGLEMAITFLAAASTAVCAPLNPAYTEQEFEFYLADLQARAVIAGAQSPAVAVARRLDIPVFPIPEAGVRRAGGIIEPRCPDDVALVLHTSGTTARPKIVPLTHRNLCASAENIRRTLRLREQDRCLNVMPLFHIHGLVGALLSSLSAGASVACTPGFSAADFFPWMDEFRPTWYTAVPTMHQAVLARAQNQREIIARNPLRFIRSSSAALAPSVMQALETVFHAPVIESYGMTEAAHQMASNPLPPGKRKPGSVGLPAGPEIALQEGEIVIRGENIMRGYENNPSANEISFSNGWFRTGDLGCFDEEGFLFVTGRIKELINRGGEKISPREVDEVLVQHPAVLEAITFAAPHSQLGEAVGAAIVLKPEAKATALEIREFVAERLAGFKVPEVVKFVDAIPRGATGKIQRIGLAARLGIEPIGETGSRKKAEYVPPRAPMEIQVAEIWAEILKLERIGIHDNFFYLGGDSFAATRLMTRVSQELGANVSFLRFLEAPTVATMAAEIAHQPAGASSARLVPIQPNGSQPPLFCAPGHDGSLLVFCNLARHLAPDRPVLGFPPPQLKEREACYRLEDLATGYIKQMRDYQPQGPYHLVGYCHGGTTAYEMARQLQACGEPVALLAMLDTFNPRCTARISFRQKWRHLRWRINFQRQALAEKTFKDRASYLCRRARAFRSAIGFKAGLAAYRLLMSTGRRVPAFLRDVHYANAFALSEYIPGPFPGSAALFRVLDLRPDAPQMGWSGLISGDVRILDSPFHFRGVQAESTAALMAHQLEDYLRSHGP